MVCPSSQVDKSKRALVQQHGDPMARQPGKKPTRCPGLPYCIGTAVPKYPSLIGEGAFLVHHQGNTVVAATFR